MSVQGVIVGLCVLAALGYFLHPWLQRWFGKKAIAQGALQADTPVQGQGASCGGGCSRCGNCQSAR